MMITAWDRENHDEVQSYGGEYALAISVIRQAIKDATCFPRFRRIPQGVYGRTERNKKMLMAKKTRDEARAWLSNTETGNYSLAWWCQIIGYPPEHVRAYGHAMWQRGLLL